MATEIKIIVCYWKDKSLLFKQKYFSRHNLKQYSLIIIAGNIIFEETWWYTFLIARKW